MKKIAFLLVAIFALFSPSTVFAARDLTITSDKSSLSGEDEAEITVTTSGFTEGEFIYIKGAFFQDGSTNYFGYTKSDDSWIKNSETATKQRRVKIGEWDGKIIVKGDFSDTGFHENGSYKFKVGFYYTTTDGDPSSVNWSSNILDFNLTEPEPSPTPQSSPSPSPSPTPTTSSSTTTAKKSPSPSPKVSPKVSPSPSPSQSPQVLAEKKDITDGFNNLANSGALNSPSPEALTYYGSYTKNFSLILAGAGAIFIGLSFIFYLWYKKSLEAKAQVNKGNDRFDNDKDPQT